VAEVSWNSQELNWLNCNLFLQSSTILQHIVPLHCQSSGCILTCQLSNCHHFNNAQKKTGRIMYISLKTCRKLNIKLHYKTGIKTRAFFAKLREPQPLTAPEISKQGNKSIHKLVYWLSHNWRSQPGCIYHNNTQCLVTASNDRQRQWKCVTLALKN